MVITPSGQRRRHAWRCLIYGGSGIGKTTLASLAPKPLLIDLEDGGEYVKIDRTDVLKNYNEVVESLREFYKSDYKTAVIDTMDLLEIFIHEHVCREHGWKTIESPGFGKGYAVATETWMKLLAIFDMCVNAEKNILCIGHEQIKSYNAPDMDSYDRYTIKLNAKSANLIVARMDAVLFCQWETMLVKDKGKDDRKFARGTGDRVIHTVEKPAWVAKSRFNLDETEPMTGDIFAKFNK